MAVELIFHVSSDERLGAYYQDYKAGMDALGRQGRFDDRIRMKDLYLNHIAIRIGRKTSKQLGVYLRQRQAWKQFNGYDIYCTAGPPPAVCYAVRSGVESPDFVYVASICGDYPGGRLQSWWDTVVKPRIGALP